MLDVLIIDDDDRKAEKIASVIRRFEEIPGERICVAKSQIEGKRLLREKLFDLVILDLQLPSRAGGVPVADGGVSVLQEIHSRGLYHKPTCIVGLTAYPELLTASGSVFSETMWNIVLYDDTSAEWSDRIAQKVRYLLEAKARKGSASTYNYRVGIITALNRPEFEAVLRLTEWKRCDRRNDSTIYMGGTFTEGNKCMTVVAACAPQMGIPAAAVLATKLVARFAPQYLALVGVTAGLAEKTRLGDFVVADPCWDWGGGK